MSKQTHNSNNNNIGIVKYNNDDDHQEMQQFRVPSASSEGDLTSIWTGMLTPSYAHCQPKAMLETDLSQKLSLHAPLTALGLSHKNNYSYKNTMNNKLRMRKQVGITNRWRLPEPLGSDLLGTSQALRAISTPLNETLIKIITAESPQIAVNLDLNQPYRFRQIQDRPTTASLCSPSYKRRTRTLPEVRRECSAPSVFSYCTRRNAIKAVSDITLHCLGTRWNLHSSHIDKSPVLVDVLFVTPCGKSDDRPKQDLLRKPKSASDIHTNSRNSRALDKRFTLRGMRRNSADSPSNLRNYMHTEMFHIDLEAEDPNLTKEGLAVALASLYQDEVELTNDKLIIPVLAAARLLQMKELTDKCVKVMLESLNAGTVGLYYDAAMKYKLHEFVSFCERWTELHLIPIVSKTIHLREVPHKLFEEVLFSESLFTDNEFSVYRTICYWTYFHLNPDCQSFPYSFSTVMAFFNGLTKQLSFLETEEGFQYQHLFSVVRFHGITDANHLQQIRTMNILPRSLIVNILSQHFDSLYCGGDMLSISEFESASIRRGLVINYRDVYDPEVVLLYGFYFNLKIEKIENTYHLYIERLRPSESTLSFRESERHTFSLRAERIVTYSITAASLHHTVPTTYKTGVLSHTFRVEEKHSRSQKLIITEPQLPLFATFSMLFPRS